MGPSASLRSIRMCLRPKLDNSNNALALSGALGYASCHLLCSYIIAITSNNFLGKNRNNFWISACQSIYFGGYCITYVKLSKIVLPLSVANAYSEKTAFFVSWLQVNACSRGNQGFKGQLKEKILHLKS